MSFSSVCRFLLLVGALVWLAAAPVSAATVTVAWDQNPEPDVFNYNVFVSTQSGVFTTGTAVGNRMTWTFTGLQDQVQYYFAVQAQSPSGWSSLSQIGFLTPTKNPPGSEAARSDFNGDGKFDLVWQHQTTGQLTAWHMNGPVVVSSRFLTPSVAGLEWKIRGSGDFNADGKPDLVWQNVSTGDTLCWIMDGAYQFSAFWFTPTRVDQSWEIASVADLNLDGKPDLVWTNPSTGQVVVWYMNGTNMVSQAWISATPQSDPNWKVRGTGDFNRDGKPDLVWQNDVTGQPVVWLMNGPTQVSAAMLPGTGSGAWKIRAIGDTNLDGWSDIVYHNSSTGAVVFWSMNGTTVWYTSSAGTVDPNWKISAPR
jgi:hypothetical protein